MNNMSTFIQGLREQIGGHSSYPPRVIREMLKKGELPGAKLRGKWRVSRRQLIGHVERLATGGVHIPGADEILDGTFPDMDGPNSEY